MMQLLQVRRLNQNSVDDTTEQYYHDLSRELRKQAHLLDRVYGESTRQLIRSHSKGAAEQAKADSLYPVSIFMSLKKFESYISTHAFQSALEYKVEIEALFDAAIANGKISDTVLNYLDFRYKDTQTLIPKMIDFSLVDMERKYSQTNHLYNGKEFKVNAEDLNNFDVFSIRLFEEAASVTLSFSTGNISEVVFTGESVSSAEVNLQELKTKHNLTNLPNLAFELVVTDENGEQSKETGKLFGETPFVFSGGTYFSDQGYSVRVDHDYKVYPGSEGSSVIFTENEEAGGNGVIIEKLDPNTDLEKLHEDSIDYLKHTPGIPEDYAGHNYFEDTDIEVVMHLIVQKSYHSEEIIVFKVDGQLIKFYVQVEGTHLVMDVRSDLLNMAKTINFE
ncbi:hypothetical protein IM538_21680 [Cytobacillus suaedae]|nr:hypothetical protein IM538_21680 [Cytobacillus suaedae]